MSHRRTSAALLCLSVMLAVSPAVRGQDANSQTLSVETRREVEARGATFVEAINSEDQTVRREKLQMVCAKAFLERVSVDRAAELAASIQERLGHLTFHHAELTEMKRGDSVSRVLHVYVKSQQSGRWHDLQIRVEPAAPNLLQEVAFIADVSEPVYLPNADLVDAPTQAWFGEYIDRLVEQESLSGAILLAIGDRIVFERYFGFADAAARVPVTPETRFNLGSGNKMFTALSVLLLEREGLLRLDDPIAKYFEDFPDRAAAAKVTIAHLLSHTSGIGEYWTKETAEAVGAAGSAAELLPLVYKAGIRTAPGEEYSYSNSNFVLAGLIVEKVSKQAYDAFVRERITGPLGMSDTDTYMMDGSEPRLAERLARDGAKWKEYPKLKRGGPAGGGFSTPRDVLKFARSLVAGKVVPRDTLSSMTSSKTPAATRNEEYDYGYGFILSKVGQQTCFGHGGIAPGVNFEFRYYPGLDATLITFSNQDNGAYDDLRRTAEKLLTGVR